MSFKDLLKRDAAGLFMNQEEHAEMVNYTSQGGAAKQVAGVFSLQGEREESVVGGRSRILTGQISFLRDATDGIPSPAVNDKVEIDGQTWTVKNILSADEAMTDLEIEAQIRVEHSKQEYRRG